MDPGTFNDMPHLIIDDENLAMGDDVATSDHVGTGDGAFFSSQCPQDSPHLENLENEYGTYYSNLMNWASDVLSPNNTRGPINPKRVPKKLPKLNLMVDDGIITKENEPWCFAMTLFEDAVKR
ncbi:hypothetical protein L2E82_01105 [Cichorium intybus]|uniref:Uncharacterized protein n=1 Tax=Cichorium intybus TaxID=13427 RepID=A0ACB9GZ38_CICIN|nr:hypothetical protein L2E82_01105 [Cichorium intybus]